MSDYHKKLIKLEPTLVADLQRIKDEKGYDYLSDIINHGLNQYVKIEKHNNLIETNIDEIISDSVKKELHKYDNRFIKLLGISTTENKITSDLMQIFIQQLDIEDLDLVEIKQRAYLHTKGILEKRD